MIKEGNYIKYGNNNIVNDLGESDSNSHWSGFRNADYSKFWSVNQKFYNVRDIKRLPIRIFKPDQQKLITQVAFPVYRDDEKKELNTLLDLIRVSVPEIIVQIGTDIHLTHKIIIQGAEPTLDMGLLWIVSNLSSPDNFLYIILQPPKIQIL